MLSTLICLQRYLVLLTKDLFSIHKLLPSRFRLQIWLYERLTLGIADFNGTHHAYFECWNLFGFKNHKAAGEIVCYFHEATVVFKHATVVWSAENSYKFTVSEEFVTIVDDQVASANEVDFVFVAKVFNYVTIEGKTDTTFIFFPLFFACFWVTP